MALLLHGALLAALLFARPLHLAPPLAQPSISLLLQKPAGAAKPGVNPKPAALRPKAPEMPAQLPAAPARIANTPRLHSAAHLKPPRSAAAARGLPPAPAGIARQIPVPDRQGFVAAAPLAGDTNQPPDYPQEALAHGEQGKVLLSIHVLPDGRTDFVSVTQSSGYRILDQAAADAVLHWRFQPATMAGNPVVQVIPYWINFDLQTGAVNHGQ
jgi:protein TonB